MMWQDNTSFSPLETTLLSEVQQDTLKEFLGIIWEAGAGSLSQIVGTSGRASLATFVDLKTTLADAANHLELVGKEDILAYIPYQGGLKGAHLLLMKPDTLHTLGKLMLPSGESEDDTEETFQTFSGSAAELLNQVFRIANENLSAVFELEVSSLSPVMMDESYETLLELFDLEEQNSPLVGVHLTLQLEGNLGTHTLLSLMPVSQVNTWLNTLAGSTEGVVTASPSHPSPSEPHESVPSSQAEGLLSNDDIDALLQNMSFPETESMASRSTTPMAPPSVSLPQNIPTPEPAMAFAGHAGHQAAGFPMGGQGHIPPQGYPPSGYPEGYGYPQPPYQAQAPLHGQQQTPVRVQPVAFQPFPAQEGGLKAEIKNLDLLMDIPLELKVQLGKSDLPLKQVLDLTKGSIIELDRVAGEAVDLLANERLIARGEVVVIEENFGIRITQIISPIERLRSL
jgi:flagellar motor switch protein FliN/FliY